MPPAFIEFKRRLRWADADAAGRLHFPRIFEIIEEAESELLRGIEWPMDVRRRNYDFPRVHLECQFRRIIALDAPFRLRLTVGRMGRTSIRYDYQVFDADEELAIEGMCFRRSALALANDREAIKCGCIAWIAGENLAVERLRFDQVAGLLKLPGLRHRVGVRAHRVPRSYRSAL